MFFKYTRMSVASFTKLLEEITPLISSRRASDGIGSEQNLAIAFQQVLNFFLTTAFENDQNRTTYLLRK